MIGNLQQSGDEIQQILAPVVFFSGYSSIEMSILRGKRILLRDVPPLKQKVVSRKGAPALIPIPPG